MTEAHAKQVDAEWGAHNKHRHHVNILQGFGLSERDLRKEQEGQKTGQVR